MPTFIITLNWADVVSQAHNLDAQLKQIEAKSSEGFPFAIDLQVQIHIPDTQAPYVISMVGSVANLVNEVLQAAVGNHFRNKLQGMPAVSLLRKWLPTRCLQHFVEVGDASNHGDDVASCLECGSAPAGRWRTPSLLLASICFSCASRLCACDTTSPSSA